MSAVPVPVCNRIKKTGFTSPPTTTTEPSSPVPQCNSYQRSTRRSILFLILIFGSSLIGMAAVYSTFPQLKPEEQEIIRLPRNIKDAKDLGFVLSQYKDDYYIQVLAGVFVTYIFLQSFAIPGSIFLSILSGFLFPFSLALFLVCSCSAIGASFCYLISSLVTRPLLLKYFPSMTVKWSNEVDKQREHMLNYIIFLRITPILPNWFINMVSPIINVPWFPFALGTFIGVAPPSFVAIQTGTTLHKLATTSDAATWTSLIILAILAILSLLPVLLKKYMKKQFKIE